jgi:4-carboxymuconolactone decarboxylase
MPRIDPVPNDRRLDSYRLPDGRHIELFAILARSTPALDDLKSATTSCLNVRTLTVRQREVLLLRVVARAGCTTEWQVHVDLFGAKAGLTTRELDALCRDQADGLSDDEALLVRLADALHDTADVDDELWQALETQFGSGGVLDAVMIATQYAKVAVMIRILRITPPFSEAAAPAAGGAHNRGEQ